MNQDLERKWDEAEKTGQPIPVGDIVVCDSCNEDFTSSPAEGGIIFGSNAWCPACAERMMPSIVGYNEQRLIRATCPAGVRFADFVRQYRGPNATVAIYTGDEAMRRIMGAKQ